MIFQGPKQYYHLAMWIDLHGQKDHENLYTTKILYTYGRFKHNWLATAADVGFHEVRADVLM